MFEYEGVKYTLNDLEIEAKKQGVDVNDFIKQMEGAGMERVVELATYDYKKESRTYGESWGNALGRTGLNLFSGATDYVDMSKRLMIDLYFDMQGENVDKNTRKTVINALEEQDGLMQMFGPGLKGVGEQDVFELGINYFGLDERIEADQTITEDLKDLNFSRAGARIIESGLESAPSLMAAYLGAPAMVAYAAILAGDKFQEEYENNPDESIKKLYFNATVSGGIEMGFEMVTRGLLKRAGIIAKNGNAKAAREMLKGGSTSLIKNIGVGFTGEGLSEAATELTQTLFDALPSDMGGLGKEIPSFDKLKYILGDNFIVGGFIGGGISTFGEISKRGKDAEQRATLLLMEETEKSTVFDIGKEIAKLQKDHSKANSVGKKIIETEIINKAKNIQKIYNSTKLGLDNLNSNDLKTYSQNVSDINSLKQDIKENVDNNSIKDINGKKIKDLVDTNKKLLGEAITKGTKIQETALQESIKFAKEKGETIGKKTIVVKDDAASQLEYNKLREKYGEPEKNVAGTDGFILGDTIVINETVARESGAIAVGSHELLHGVIGNSFGKLTTVERAKLGKSFMSVLTSKQEAAVRKRLKNNYRIEGDAVFQSEEMFTAFSDAIMKKEISFNENIFSKIGNSIQETLRKLSESGYIGKESFLYRKEFSNGRQVYNFLKDYNKNVQKGELSKRTQDFAKIDFETTEVKKSLTAKQSTNKVNELGEMGWTNKSWKEQGADFAIKEMQDNKMLDGLILAQPHVGIDNDTFLQTTYAELLPHVRNYKPENKNPNGLFGWINPQISNKAKQAYNSITKEEIKGTRDIGETTKEGEVKIQVAAETDAATEAFETEDLSITGQAQKKESEAKAEKQKQSIFRNKIGFKTGSQIYDEILDAAKKSLIRAYGKTQTIKDTAARERAVVEELQKEHNSLTSPLFKQIKNWLGYGKPQEAVAAKTKDIYFDNLIEFREEIVKLISTADLVQIERLVAESDRVFTRYKETLTKQADVQKAVDNLQLPPDAINTIKKGQSVRLYEKVIPGEIEIIEYADQPGSMPSKKDPTKMVRSGLKGTRKDGIAKNIVNGLVFDAAMEARQSQEVQDKAKEMDVDARSVEQLGAALGRSPNVKFSKNINSINVENLNSVLNKDINYTKLMGSNQIRKSRIAIENIIQSIDPQGVNSSLIPIFDKLKNNINLGLLFAEIVNTTFDDIQKSNIGTYQMQALLYDGVFSPKHLTNILAKAKRITEVQIKQIAFQGAVTELQDKVEKANTKEKKIEIIKNWLINNSKSSRTSKVKYNGETITTNKQMFKEVIEPLGNLGFDFKTIKEGTKITHNKENLNTYKKIIKIKQDPGNSINIIKEESEQAKKWFFDILKSKLSPETKKARIALGAVDMVGPVRKMAELVGYVTNYKGKSTLEHRVTINEIVKSANEYIDNPSDKNLKTVEKKVNESKVILLPNDIVEVINKQYKTTGSLKTIMNLPSVKSIIDKKGYNFVNYSNVKFSKSQDGITFDNALKFSRSTNNETRGITVLDFDDTLATTKSLVKFTRPNGTTGTLNAEQYASTYENLLGQGYTFDFSEFNKVVKGKLAPLFQKALKLQGKFGPDNMFVLTARPPQAAKAIFDFLKANGLNIPIKNIAGLANSTAGSKALWIADKVGEGYNDFYFADDALQNVKAVKNMLNQLDVKSKVQQARVKFSKSMDNDFNKVLQRTTGTPAKEIISAARAAKRGAKKGKYKFFFTAIS